jgi:hypothetical protein
MGLFQSKYNYNTYWSRPSGNTASRSTANPVKGTNYLLHKNVLVATQSLDYIRNGPMSLAYIRVANVRNPYTQSTRL